MPGHPAHKLKPASESGFTAGRDPDGSTWGRRFPLGLRATLSESVESVTALNLNFEIVLYGLFVLGGFGFLWIYYDRRDRTLYEAERKKITFHCIRCNQLYTEKAGTDTASCPQCGHTNVRLKF